MKLKKCAKDLQLFEDVTVQKVLSTMIDNGVVVYRKGLCWSIRRCGGLERGSVGL